MKKLVLIPIMLAAILVSRPAAPKLSPVPIEPSFEFRLNWTKHSGDFIYQLVEDRRSNFSTPGSPQYWPTGNFENIPARQPGTYYYRVRAWNNLPENKGVPGPWSNVITVHIISDTAFMDLVSRRTFNYFVKTTSSNGLTLDRLSTVSGSNGIASTAASGFYLSALTIGAKRGWMSKPSAYNRAKTTLNVFYGKTPNVHGFFYHFLKPNGAPSDAPCREVSSVDTAIMAAGALQAGEYFGGDVKILAEKIYSRIEWDWFYDSNIHLLRQSWTESAGLNGYYWSYSEAIMAYLLAIGSPSHPIPAEAFYSFHRPKGGYGGPDFIFTPGGELFTYQYPHAWFDFRNTTDSLGVNWWQNSIEAARANQRFAIDNAGSGYSALIWGLTASDGQDGYHAYGARPAYSNYSDGTIAPSGAGGSIALVPDIALASLKYYYTAYGNKLWKTYGFVGAFNPQSGWVDTDYVSIDQGIILLMLENKRNALIWQTFMRNKNVIRALSNANFSGFGASSDITIESFEEDGFWNPDTALGWWDADGAAVYNRSASEDPSHGGFESMKVEYSKNNFPWSYFAGYISTSNVLRDFTSRGRLVVWAYGSADILVKLRDRSGNEAELGAAHAANLSGWTKLTFDYTNVNSVDLSDIENIMFFVAPGEPSASGVVYLDDIGLE